jgi:lipopolysaccharide transport system ATP-binding protein
MNVIEVSDVWKRFRIPHERNQSPLQHLADIVSGGKRYKYEEFWALKQINLELGHGNSLGIVGPNGSGKSTLLKLIARVMKPDKGKVVTVGSIAPILELGIGFHGDLTVKENAIVYGVILGLRLSEVKRRTQSIVDFAGLTRFRDARLKNLSSGMLVRLAFSIAIQTDANIYLVDEALSVGDMEFQERCLEKFREFKKEKKSIVLVSHNMEVINSFCERSLYILNGEARAFGPSEETTNRYVQDMKTYMVGNEPRKV